MELPNSIRVEFCSLDAKDNYYTGYSVAGFVNGESNKPLELSQQMEGLHIMLNREYLVELKKLQNSLAVKYQAAARHLRNHTPPVPEDKLWGSALDRKTYEAAELAAKHEFPGEEAEYYT
jgi:hypothetical protein